jgi:hypothetical protein
MTRSSPAERSPALSARTSRQSVILSDKDGHPERVPPPRDESKDPHLLFALFTHHEHPCPIHSSRRDGTNGWDIANLNRPLCLPERVPPPRDESKDPHLFFDFRPHEKANGFLPCQAPPPKINPPASRNSFIPYSLIPGPCFMKFAGNYAPKAHNGTMMKHDRHPAITRSLSFCSLVPASLTPLTPLHAAPELQRRRDTASPAASRLFLCLLIDKLPPNAENR